MSQVYVIKTLPRAGQDLSLGISQYHDYRWSGYGKNEDINVHGIDLIFPGKELDFDHKGIPLYRSIMTPCVT